MEEILAKIRTMNGEFNDLRQNFQSNGTPLRSGTKLVRESIESSYGVFISSMNKIESDVDHVTSKIDQFRHNNATIVNYCLVHPSTAIFGSTSIVAIPSYFAFGLRGMMLGAAGAASFSTLFIGALFYSKRQHK